MGMGVGFKALLAGMCVALFSVPALALESTEDYAALFPTETAPVVAAAPIPGALIVEVKPLPVVAPSIQQVQLNLIPESGPQVRTAWDSDDDGRVFRKQDYDRKINLLLYGMNDAQQQSDQVAQVQAPVAPLASSNLKQFMDNHFNQIKRDYFNQDDPTSARLVAGDPSFISETMTQGIAQKPAKLAGVTVPVGKVTIGGGYTWDERNPLLMQEAKRGLIVGARFNAGKIPVQVSYLTAGRDIAGISTGGGDYTYDNVMVGASIPVGEKWYINSTLQYRNDNNRIESEQQQVIVTFGTKIRF